MQQMPLMPSLIALTTAALSRISLFSSYLAAALLLAASSSAIGQTSQRWFQIELSIFSNESYTDRDEELWLPERSQLSYPDPIRRLQQLSDLLVTEQMINSAIGEPQSSSLTVEEAPNAADPEALLAIEREERLAQILATGPQPARAEGDFKFYDFLRDPYVQLTAQDSDFQQTNRALERSSENRLLFHGLWRESLADPRDAIPLYIQGGLRYGDQHELQGSITLRFNDNRDRIVIESNLWLTEYSVSAPPDSGWQLPPVPEAMVTKLDSLASRDENLQYGVNRIFHMRENRDMRSTEFHYIDHPAMGIVILVEPYDVPPLPLPEFEFEEAN